MNRLNRPRRADRGVSARVGSVLSLPLLAMLLAGWGAAHAAECSVAAVGIAFEEYDPLQTSDDVPSSPGSITVSCRNFQGSENGHGVPVEISADPGGSGSYAARSMTGPGGSRLAYNLYLDPSAAAPVWGNGSGATEVIRDVARKSNQAIAIPFYGRIPAGQDEVPAGAYADRISILVVF